MSVQMILPPRFRDRIQLTVQEATWNRHEVFHFPPTLDCVPPPTREGIWWALLTVSSSPKYHLGERV